MFWLLNHANEILNAAAQVVAAASIIANITRTDKDNKAVTKIGKAVDFLALNWSKYAPRDPGPGNE